MCLHILPAVWQSEKRQKMAKNINFGSDTHISDAKMNPLNTFGLDVFTYLKHICVQIKEKIPGKTASGFLIFWQNTGPKKPVNEPSPFEWSKFRFVAWPYSSSVMLNIFYLFTSSRVSIWMAWQYTCGCCQNDGIDVFVTVWGIDFERENLKQRGLWNNLLYVMIFFSRYVLQFSTFSEFQPNQAFHISLVEDPR